MPTYCCVRGCKSKGNGKIKYFRFPKDVNRRQQWIEALDRENFVPTNNTLICEEHFTINDYQKRPDLIKLTNVAVPSIFNCMENGKQNASQNKIMYSRSKFSRIPARKRYGNLSDHTYVLKLPEESIISEDRGFQKSISPSKCVVHTLNADELRVLDVSKSNIQTLKIIESPGFKIPENFKIICQPPEKNWENIAIIQKNIIHKLRKKVKVLQQKVRRNYTTMELLKEQLEALISY